MFSQFNRPRPLAWFFFLAAFATTVGLGTWQVKRLQWKESLIATIDAAKEDAPITDALPLEEAELETLNFRPACARGTWLQRDGQTIEFHVFPRFYNGTNGYFIVSPLVTKTQTVLINRGWVPMAKKLLETRPETAVQGAAKICGLLRVGNERNWLTPPNDAARNLWFGRDVAEMAAAAKLENVVPGMLDIVGKQDAKRLPVPSDGVIRLRNDHLSYIITWYGIALGILIIFLLYHRKK